MMKYIRYLFGFILLCSQVTAMQEEKAVEEVPIKVTVETRVSGQVDDLAFRSITKKDALAIEAIISRCDFKEGLTQNTQEDSLVVNRMAKNLGDRQESFGNPYSGVLLSIGDEPVGFLTIGVMSALGFGDGYKLSEHAEIIKTFLSMGAIKPKGNISEDAKFALGAYEKVDDCGLAMFVPALPRGSKGLDEKHIRDALRIGVSVCETLKNEGKRLPRGENTIPGYVMGLFDPTDPLIPDLKAVGFQFIENEGFVEFYPPKQRILGYVKLK